MTIPENSNQGANVQRLAKPPFVVGSWVALAYVEGTYNPPSRKATVSGPDDFLGIYLSKEDPGFGLITLTGLGKYVAFHRCGDADSTAEFAAIDAFIHYEIPFEQWRLYPLEEPEALKIQQLGIGEAYERAMKGVAAVLYQARLRTRPSRPKLDPMFLISLLPHTAIWADEVTERSIWRFLLGEERAARHFRNIEKLKERIARAADDVGGTCGPT